MTCWCFDLGRSSFATTYERTLQQNQITTSSKRAAICWSRWDDAYRSVFGISCGESCHQVRYAHFFGHNITSLHSGLLPWDSHVPEHQIRASSFCLYILSRSSSISATVLLGVCNLYVHRYQRCPEYTDFWTQPWSSTLVRLFFDTQYRSSWKMYLIDHIRPNRTVRCVTHGGLHWMI